MAKKRGRKPKKVGIGLKLKRATVFSILTVGFFLLSLITIFAFLKNGSALTSLNQFFWGIFGFISLLLPFLFLLTAVFFSKLKTPLREINVLIGAIILFLSLLGLFHSGNIGFFLWDQVSYLITGIGAFLIFFGGSLIGLVVLFNTSLEQVAKGFWTVLMVIKKYTFGLKDRKKKLDSLFIGGKEAGKNVSGKETQANLPEKTLPVGNLVVNTASSSKKLIWQYPPLEILRDDLSGEADRGDVRGNANIIEKTLESFGITARVKEVNRGPAVTQYALEVALGTKLSKITALSNDLALALAAPTGQIRIEAPVPGRSLVGIEVPNRSPATVSLREMIESKEMKKNESKISVPLGLDVSGETKVADIARMPHVLIAGQTGSGKSVLLNSWISTVLFKTTPDEVKLILIDPKRVELTRYNNIPHLLVPVVVEPAQVLSVLSWAMSEMDRRYRLFAEQGARNMEIYNEKALAEEKLPYILIIIDELADIMLFAPTQVEDTICRIAQMARATGIHLILATQRPSVDVLTGLIKANIPTRISFAVASMIDSRVILDTPGAEKLLGRGDMLYTPPDQAKPTRIQGAFVTDGEVNQLIEFLKNQGKAEYREEIFNQPVPAGPGVVMVNGEERDEFFENSAELVRSLKKASASLLQRKLKVGYARAARILDQLEAAGIVGPARGSKSREVVN